MQTFAKLLAVMILVSAAGLIEGVAGEKVKVSLYFAQNEALPANCQLAPEKLRPRLKEVFGYRHYELKKSQDIALRNEWEQWFVPRKDFFLKLEPLHAATGDAVQIEYEIYKDGFIVAKGKYMPGEDTPLFINGPDFHRGRFLFVLEAR